MIGAKVAFWTSLFLMFYTYLLYPLILFIAYSVEQTWRDWCYLILRRNRRTHLLTERALPPISLIIPAYNEESYMARKIQNIQTLDYPPERLEVVVVSDGSVDRTNEILKRFEGAGVNVVYLHPRQGKPTALNRGVVASTNGILVLSDTSALLSSDSIRQLVRHFSDPTVGVVCGALEFEGGSEFSQTEGIYWRYESMLRLMESRLGATLTADGPIYAVRREAFRPLEPDVVLDDFVIPMNARKLGYRVLYDPEARAIDIAAESVASEFTRRVRLAVGSFQALGNLIRIPFDPFTYLAFVSHKLLRWMLPFFMIGLLVSSVFMLDNPFYQTAFIGQLLFYLWAAAGFIFRRRLGRIRYALIGYYLLAMHLAFLVGFIRFVSGRADVKWQRVS